MADVAKLVEEHLQHRCDSPSAEANFARCLSIADKFEAHGIGVVIEELMITAELIEHQRSAAAPSRFTYSRKRPN